MYLYSLILDFLKKYNYLTEENSTDIYSNAFTKWIFKKVHGSI